MFKMLKSLFENLKNNLVTADPDDHIEADAEFFNMEEWGVDPPTAHKN